MTVLFLANVGNHDVRLTDRSLLPTELADQRLSARQLGETILAHYAHYAPALDLPLIGVSLRWLLEREQVAPGELYVHLFASDQPPETPAREWSKDTVPFAQVIQRFLKEGGLEWTAEVEQDGQRRKTRQRLRLSRRQMHVHSIVGNPADYGTMLDFFGQKLPWLAAKIGPGDRVYVEVSGGTPAMTSMLIIAGVNVFGQRADTLYVERGADEPYRISVGRRLLAGHACDTLRTQLDLCAYAAASATFDAEKDLLPINRESRLLIEALLKYADCRLAFDFHRAREALNEARLYARGETRSRVENWWRELGQRDSALFLTELVHGADIKYQLGEYADFTQRLFRFQEASFRHLAEEMGMRYRDPDSDEHLDLAWADKVAGLRPFLDQYPTPDGYPLRLDTSLNRISLGAIVDFFTQHDPHWTGLRSVVESTHRLSAVAKLRNKGLAGHGFVGIGKEDLDQQFGGDADQIIPLLRQIYEAIFGQPVKPNPYVAINGLLSELLAA